MLTTMSSKFEWDEHKAERNRQNHNVDFEEAKTVFNDALSITVYDQAHSDDEERFIDLGLSVQGNLLVVVYTERDSKTRIISARRATNHERKQYEQE